MPDIVHDKGLTRHDRIYVIKLVFSDSQEIVPSSAKKPGNKNLYTILTSAPNLIINIVISKYTVHELKLCILLFFSQVQNKVLSEWSANG